MDFRSAFKPYRNRLARFDKWSLVQHSIRKLHELHGQPVEAWATSGWIPWELLLFLRHALEYGGLGLPPRVKPASDADFRRLVSELQTLRNDRYQDILERDDIVEGGTHPGYFFLRMMAFEQLTPQIHLQPKGNPYSLCRAISLFVDGDYGGYNCQDAFVSQTGLSPRVFLEMYCVLDACVNGRRWHGIDEGWTYAEHGYSVDERARFLDAISNDWNTVGQWFHEESKRRVKNPYFQITEVSPLVRRPLLRRNGKLWCYSPLLLAMGMESFIYDRMREVDGNTFTSAFGGVFERYVEEVLAATKLKYVAERELRGALGEQKVVDFAIVVGEIVVLVEAKGVEVAPIAQVKPDAKTWAQTLGNITKAVTQFFQVAEAISEGVDCLPKMPSERVFGLVVTYKEHFLGPAESVWSDFLEEEVRRKGANMAAFRPENLLFTSIQDLELMLQVVGQDPERFERMIRTAADDNTKPTSRKQIFRQHVPVDIPPGDVPERALSPVREFWRGIYRRIGSEMPEIF